jgi:hypothetical protein
MSKQKYPQASVGNLGSGKTVNRPRKVNGYSNFHLHAKKNRKRDEAEARQAAYAKLPIAEKMKHAGKKELAKLEKRLATQTPPAVKIAPMTEEQKAVKAVKRAKNAVKA